MFNKKLTELTLTSDIANSYFSQIQGDYYRDDRSFVATLRALLLNRIKDHNIGFRIRAYDFSADTLRNASANAVVSAVCNRSSWILNLVDLTSQGALEVAYEKFCAADGMAEFMPKATEAKDLEAFVEPFANVKIYIDEDRCCTNIIVDHLDMRKFHALQMLIPRYIPWLFNEDPLTQEELALLNTLHERYAPEYERLIEEFAQKIDLRSAAIKSVLGGFEVRAKKQQLKIARDSLSRINSSIMDNMARYSDLINQKDEASIRICGLEAIIEAGIVESELIDYFTANKCLYPVSASGTHLKFIVSTYLESFDPEMYRTMSARAASHLFSSYTVSNDCFRDLAPRKKLMDAIFSDEPIFRVKSCSCYDLDIRGTVDVHSGYNFGSKFADRIENPHLKYHGCLGNHRRFICDYLNEGDVMGAVEQCISSAKSVNIGESATIRYFLPELFDCKQRVLELEDGTCMNPEEALKYLEEKEAQKEEAANA